MATEILIIDDNADIRNILDELIQDAGYKTRLAANFNQGLSEIDKKLPDVAIIDVKLDKGDYDGIQLLEHIKKEKSKKICKEEHMFSYSPHDKDGECRFCFGYKDRDWPRALMELMYLVLSMRAVYNWITI